MKLLGYILLACLVIAALQWAVLLLLIAAAIGFLISLINDSKGTLGAVALFGVLGLFSAFPWLLLAFLALVAISVVINATKR